MTIYFIFAASLVNSITTRAARVALPLYMLELGGQPLAIGVLAASFSVLPMLLSVPAGKLADRYGSRWLLIFAAIIGGIGMLIPHFVPSLPSIFAAAVLIGMSLGIYNVLLQNVVGLLSKPENRVKNFSNLGLMGPAANFLGPLVAGLSIDHFGHAYTCLYLALSTLVPVVMFTAPWGKALQAGVSETKHKSAGGIRNLLADPAVRRTIATGSLLIAGQDLFTYYMPVYAHSLGLSASVIGVILAAFATAAFVVRTVLARLIGKYKEEKLLAYAFYMSMASLLIIPLFKDPIVLSIVAFIFGLGMGCGQPIITMLMFNNSAEGRSGEALGLRMTAHNLTKLVSPVVFGAVASAFGLPPMFWLNAMMMGVGGILSSPPKTRDRD